MRTGNLHKTTTGEIRDGYGHYSKFDEWRMYLSAGWIRVTFRKKNLRLIKWTSPFDAWLKRDIRLTPEEWAQFDKEFQVLLERQKKKYPAAHKEQKSEAIKDINYKKKMWPHIMAEPDTSAWVEQILPICRKRT